MGNRSTTSATVERIYALDCGEARVTDGSIYSPGVNVGRPMSLSCNAYLIKRGDRLMLWDTGLEDALVEAPEGRIIAHGIRGVLERTLVSQLDEIGVRPSDIGTLVLSHAHFDHVGNSRLFPQARWIVQKAEHEAMLGPAYAEYGYVPGLYESLRNNPVAFGTIPSRWCRVITTCSETARSGCFPRPGTRRGTARSS